MIRLGPFELLKTIGAGGMGEIWRAVHLSNGIPVAIKVLKPPDGTGDTDDFRESFLHEVRLIAGLRHPHVVMALDAGTVSTAADEASGGRLQAGSPFLAMELAGGGSLAGKRLESWAECRHVLVHLLDGLAHAHAHGIVHRDVKPGNLLLASARSELAAVPKDMLSARIVVTDFGIGGSREVRGFTDVYATGAPVGTPNYMAPEQVRAAWRDHGPWTDLYAVGCVAWQLVTGSTPFRDPNPVQTLAWHLGKPPPPFRPLFDVPPELEAWLRQLLAKEPEDRFVFAADARRALLELGAAAAGSGPRSAVPSVPLGDQPTVLHTGKRREEATMPPVTAGGGTRTSWAPTARQSEDPGRDFRLEGAGLGLYGLRAIPFVARATERDALWKALSDVQTSRQGRAVVLRGPSGTGKSRLAEWLARAAHEQGAGVTLKASHGADATDPVAQLAEAALRCDGLGRAEAVERVAAFLGDDTNATTEVLAQLAAPNAFTESPPLTRRETHAAAEVLLRRLAGARVCVVWLEDAHTSAEALFLTRRLLESAEPLPVLVLVTIQDEELAERPDEATFLHSLTANGAATEVVVGPLGPDEHHELVQVLLGLEGALAQRIEERTQGNPLFAVQLVGDLVARGLLVPGDRGFKLKAGAVLDIPDHLLAVWQDHAERLLATFGEDEARALELAAIFGLELRQSDYVELCTLAHLRPTAELLNEAMRRRLIRPLPGRVQRWAFVHGMLREVLLRRVRLRGDWAQGNRVCASHLRAGARPDPEKLARHLLDANDLLEALAPLHTAVAERLARGDFRSAALVTEQEQAAKNVGLPESDPRWGDVWLDWAWLYLGRGDNTEAERWAVRAERSARRHGWTDVLGRALRLSGRVERNLGRVEEAIALMHEAEQIFLSLGDAARAADCQVTIGDLYLRTNLPKAAEALKAALAMTTDPQRQVDAWMGLADCAQRSKDLPTARMCLERARETAVRAGRRNALATIANLQGEITRKAGDAVAAEALYREAATRSRALDDTNYVYPLINVGLLTALRGAWSEGTTLLEPLRERAEKAGVKTLPACFARAVLLPCAAGEGRWDNVTDHLGWLEDFLGERKVFDGDLARMAAMAGELSMASHHLDESDRCWRLALAQYQGLGDRDAAARADETLRLLAGR